MSEYRNITLVKRENINCSTISVDDFVRMMFSDILEADEKYNELYCPDYVASILRHFEYMMSYTRKNAIKYAEKKWKTEKKRNEYINETVNKAKSKFNFDSYYYNLGFFDFDVHPESNGISSNCIISINELTYDVLRRCYEAIKDNYYFKNATGWKLEYKCNDNNHSVSFRPHINLIMPEDVEAKYHKAAKDLAEDIYRFYATTSYPGD